MVLIGRGGDNFQGRARPELLGSGRYFVVEAARGRVLGAGGYSLPAARARRSGEMRQILANIRHVATDPDATRQGIGRWLMQAVLVAAEGEGIRGYDCLSTRTAVPFYASIRFTIIGPVEVPMTPGLWFPNVRMQREI